VNIKRWIKAAIATSFELAMVLIVAVVTGFSFPVQEVMSMGNLSSGVKAIEWCGVALLRSHAWELQPGRELILLRPHLATSAPRGFRSSSPHQASTVR
jgi:hypothetical protein